jgi:cysteine desulfurase
MADNKVVYLDNAATTPVRREVLEAMVPYYTDRFANPSGVYGIASECRNDVNRARDAIGETINARGSCIYFTAGGSEADNWALKGVAEANADKGRHIITTKMEHHAILNTCKYLERRGFEVTYLDVGENGIVSLDYLKRAIRPDTILISVMAANNEIGTIQPIREIGMLARKAGIIFHTDAVQAYTQLPIDVEADFIDLLSVSGHKINGPKGVGFLYVREGLKLHSFIHGGAQERKRRAGTENVPGIMGLAKAAQLAAGDMDATTARERELRDYLIDRVLREIPYTRLNGDRVRRLPGNANFSFQFVDGESLLIMLDMDNICASSGSACTTGSLEPSHVLTAIGLPPEIAHSALRLTLGRLTTREELDYTIDKLKKIVTRLRSMSSEYKDICGGCKA